MLNQVFSFQMPSDPAVPGWLVVGEVPIHRYPQGLRWLDVAKSVDAAGRSSYGYWAVNVDKVSFDGIALTGRVGLVDSGTSCLVLPAHDAKLFYDAVRKAQFSDSRCSALPSITLTLGGEEYVLTGDDYGFSQLGGCEICVQARDRERTWILGDVFHRKFAVSYDFGSRPPRIGLPPGRRPWKVSFPVIFALCAALVLPLFAAFATRRRWLRRRNAGAGPVLQAPASPANELSQRPSAAVTGV